MSTKIEDRLGAALEARAAQVQPRDLRRAQPPDAPRQVLRPVLAGLAAAAAVAAVIALPFVAGPDGGDDTAPPASGAVEADRRTVSGDVDGDGSPDSVTLEREAERLVVRLGGGRTLVRRTDPGTELLGLADVGSDRRVIVLGNLDAVVLRVKDEEIVRVRFARLPGGLRPAPEHHSGSGVAWVADGTFYTAVFEPDHGGKDVFGVQVSSWRLGGGGLEATSLGEWCWRPAVERHPDRCLPVDLTD